MMWLSSLLILMSIGGTFCGDDDAACYHREKSKCDMIERPAEFPQTAEALLATCRFVISRGNCELEARGSCGDDGFFNSDYIRSSVEYLKSTCQEENPTFKAIARNLACVERVLKSLKVRCTSIISDKNDEAIDTQIELLIGDDYGSDLARCLFDLMDVACKSTTFGYYCGEEVKEAVEEIETHVFREDYLQCTTETLEELLPFRRVLEGILVEELELQDALKKRK